jgi:cysteine desulfurase/selenocysteine lyase
MSLSTLKDPGLDKARSRPAGKLDVERLREDFPVLKQKVHGKRLVYLDNAATTQKPRVVIDALVRFYQEYNSNVHRGVHLLSERATEAYEKARGKVQRFLGAASEKEIAFVRGTTEAINLVAQAYGRRHVGPGDEVLITAMEHHSNIVPWQMLCEEKGARLRVVPISDAGELLLDEYEKLLTPRTKLVAAVYVSNALGTVNPVRRLIELAHAAGVPVLLDAAQAVPHLPLDVRELDCDFLAFSGHKVYGPTGFGILYGKARLLEAMPPYQGGGDMIRSVTFEKTLYNSLPYKFEAGTPHVEGAIGLGVALDYLTGVGLEAVAAHEQELLAYATEALARTPGVRLIGTARERAGAVSFVVEGVHPHDIGTVLDQEGVAVRTGHHCAQPVMDRFGVPATVRASLALYNVREEIDALVRGLLKVKEMFG